MQYKHHRNGIPLNGPLSFRGIVCGSLPSWAILPAPTIQKKKPPSTDVSEWPGVGLNWNAFSKTDGFFGKRLAPLQDEGERGWPDLEGRTKHPKKAANVQFVVDKVAVVRLIYLTKTSRHRLVWIAKNIPTTWSAWTLPFSISQIRY